MKKLSIGEKIIWGTAFCECMKSINNPPRSVILDSEAWKDWELSLAVSSVDYATSIVERLREISDDTTENYIPSSETRNVVGQILYDASHLDKGEEEE